MEGRLDDDNTTTAATADDNDNKLPTTADDNDKKLALPAPPAATVVIQVPRDQIYRVPPPENAIKIEQHKRNLIEQEANRQTKIRTVAIPVVLAAAAFIIALFIVRATLYSPVTPEFAVMGIHAKGLESHSPEFRVTIQGRNRNPRMAVSYTGGDTAALLFKDKKIGQGKIGSAGDGGDLTAVVPGAGVTAELKKELGDEKEKDMELNYELTVEMKSWMRNEGVDLSVSCDFRVRNSLMNVTEISFQECKNL